MHSGSTMILAASVGPQMGKLFFRSKKKNQQEIQASSCNDVTNSNTLTEKMSHENEEELLDYSDSEEPSVQATSNKAEATETSKKGSYIGVHATSFNDFMLKAELLRAIGDCGFEHPSEG